MARTTNFSAKFYISNILSMPNQSVDLESGAITIQSFYWLEDIENSFIYGNLVLSDSKNFFTKLPLIGSEQITIKVEHNDIIKEITFDIYNMKLLGVLNTSHKVYSIELVEVGFFNTINEHYCKPYSNSKVSDIMVDIVKNQIEREDNFSIENTVDIMNFVIPNWRPTTTIKYLLKVARRAKTPNESGFVFYSSFNEKNNVSPVFTKPTLNFTSIATLIEQDVANSSEPFTIGDENIQPNYINKVLQITEPKKIDNKSIIFGIGGQTAYGFDIMNKTFTSSKINYEQFIKNSPFLGTKSMHIPTTINNYNNKIILNGSFNQELIKNEILGNMRINFLNLTQRELLVAGNLEHYAGRCVQIKENAPNTQELWNRLSTGKCLIKSVTHYFDMLKNEYTLKITTVKDAFTDIDISTLPKLSNGQM